jgi:hypothetical protein
MIIYLPTVFPAVSISGLRRPGIGSNASHGDPPSSKAAMTVKPDAANSPGDNDFSDNRRSAWLPTEVADRNLNFDVRSAAENARSRGFDFVGLYS